MKKQKLTTLIAGLLCVALTVFGVIKATNSSIFEMPMFKIIIGESEIDNINNSLEEAIEKAEEAPEEEIKEFEDTADIKWDDAVDFLKNPSINRFISIGDSLNDFDSSLDLGDALELSTTFRNIIVIYALIVALFSLLGTLFRKKVFPILAIIFSLAFYLAFVGVIYLVLFIALSITHIILISKSKSLPQNIMAQE